MIERDTSAFPHPYTATGLTKREYFAAKFMAAELTRGYFEYNHPELAKRAVAAADTLISHLNEETKQ